MAIFVRADPENPFLVGTIMLNETRDVNPKRQVSQDVNPKRQVNQDVNMVLYALMKS